LEEARGDARLTEIVERVEAVNVAVSRRDFEAVASLTHPDAVWEHNIGQGSPEEGVYRGRDAVIGLLTRIVETWEYLRVEPREISDLGQERYLIHGALHAKHPATDTEIVSQYEQELTFRDGLLVHGRMRTEMSSSS
jgi:ketosteroid isomerase-like protein